MSTNATLNDIPPRYKGMIGQSKLRKAKEDHENYHGCEYRKRYTTGQFCLYLLYRVCKCKDSEGRKKFTDRKDFIEDADWFTFMDEMNPPEATITIEQIYQMEGVELHLSPGCTYSKIRKPDDVLSLEVLCHCPTDHLEQ